MPDSLSDRVKRRGETLKALRQPHEAEYVDCYRYTYPERSAGLEGADNQSTQSSAKAKRAEIYDDTAKDGTRILASSFSSGMTPANSLWFGMDSGSNETDAEARWLSDAAQFIFDNIHGENFDASAFECYLDMAAGPGMFVLYTEEAEEGGYRFEHWPFGQCHVAASKTGGRVDTIYREFEMSVEQLVAAYGRDKVSDASGKLFDEGKFDEKVLVGWLIEPRRLRQVTGYGASLAKNKPFVSCHVELGKNLVLRESGYDEFPCCVPRWMLIPGTAYATGPLSTCLATVKTLNEAKRLELVNMEMAAYGMFKARDDGVMNPHTTVIGPRRVVVVADMENFAPIDRRQMGDFKVALLKAEELQAQIRKLLLADQLQPQDGPAMTATEVHARIMLIRQQLGPIFGRLQAEFLSVLIERCFGIALRAGALEAACGPMPKSLLNREINVKYQSPLARAQKLEEVTAIDTWVTGIVEYSAATGDTTVLDEVNTVEIAKFKRDALGVPSVAQRTPDEVAELRDRRAKAKQQADQAMQQQQLQTEAGSAMAKRAAQGA